MAILIDTDVGTDVDDLFALAYAIKFEGEIKAISTVIGDTLVRSKIVRKLERILGVDIPIISGESGPEESVKKYWTGIEKLALTSEELNEPLLDADYPLYTSDTSLVCIGPLTNIAQELKINPSIKNLKDVYVMGSSDSSHNFKADPEAWKLVQNESWDIYQITKEVSEKISFNRAELEQLRVNPLGNFLYDSAIRWIDYTKRDKACMYDVLTLSAALGEKYVKFKRVRDNRFVSIDVDPGLKDKLIEKIIN